MQIKILVSLEHGLLCIVKTGRKILIDPGALLLASVRPASAPVEVAAALRSGRKFCGIRGHNRHRISHYHGDHAHESRRPISSQWKISRFKGVRFWCKGPGNISVLSLRRRKSFAI